MNGPHSFLKLKSYGIFVNLFFKRVPPAGNKMMIHVKFLFYYICKIHYKDSLVLDGSPEGKLGDGGECQLSDFTIMKRSFLYPRPGICRLP